MPPKRYVLFIGDSGRPGSERDLEEYFGRRYGPVKLIPVDGNPRALIVRTTAPVAEQLKGMRDGFTVGGTRLVPVLTSGAVGNLKRRAREEVPNGQVHE
ncbi:MAG: hypothetical protein JRM80_14605 [Nitrososphaerota archaeon]|nr:hypothetical protein [Nitrososphaerota archaeon]